MSHSSDPELARLKRLIEHLEAQVWSLQRRPASFSPAPSKGGGACDPIQFLIGAIIAPGIAEALVTGVPSGFTLADVAGITGSALTGFTNLITIYDATGCYFNEPSTQLIGRRGWAHFMQPIGSDQQDVVDPYNLPVWEVFALCCNSQACQ